jgi:hypothetical protein
MGGDSTQPSRERTVTVTIEPAGGVDAPTGEVQFSGAGA